VLLILSSVQCLQPCRLNLAADMGITADSYSEGSTPSLARSVSLELSSSLRPSAPSLMLHLSPAAYSDVAEQWAAFAGARRPMRISPISITAMLPEIPSAAHITASLRMLVIPDSLCHSRDATPGLPHRSSAAQGGIQRVATPHSASLAVVPSVHKPRPNPPRPPPRRASKPGSKRVRHSSSRSFVDKRPRYKGRFVKPDELGALLELEKAAGGAQEELAVVPLDGLSHDMRMFQMAETAV
jgi:hypothetical protein